MDHRTVAAKTTAWPARPRVWLVVVLMIIVGCGNDPAPKDDHAARVRRAWAWLEQPGNTVGTILDDPPREAEPMPDGGVRLRCWVALPGGRYAHREVVFDVQGRVVGGRDVELRDQHP